MPKMTDQEFDNLFRDAANRITPQHPQDDWDDMRIRLEVAERDARARNISLYSMVVLLLLYSFLVPDNMKIAGIERASVIPDLKQQQAQSAVAKETVRSEATRETVSPSQGAIESKAAQPEPATEGNARVKSSAIEKASIVAIQSERQRSSEIDGHSPNSSAEGSRTAYPAKTPGETVKRDVSGGASAQVLSNGSAIPDGRSAAPGSSQTTEPGYRSASAIGNAGRSTANAALIAGSADKPGVQQRLATSSAPAGFADTSPVGMGTVNSRSVYGHSVQGAPLATPSTEPLDGEVASGPATVTVPEPGKVVNFQTEAKHPWFVKLALAPDFSSIDNGKADKPGINFGPLVEYGISSRFSVTTGAIWSKKIYSQANPEKTYSRGSTTIKADMLDADCRIIDIPLNVTYYILPGRKTNFFVTMGSSSYVMLDEKYVYTVYSSYRNYEYEEKYSNKNIEWFSMLNLSVGIQHQINRRWLIQGEPFLKAPIKGVGQGKVDLSSAGAFVSLKYLINP